MLTEIFEFFVPFSLLSSLDFVQASKEGHNPFWILCSIIGSKYLGYGHLVHGIEMGFIPDTSHFQIRQTDFRYGFRSADLQTLHNPKILFRADHCDWCYHIQFVRAKESQSHESGRRFQLNNQP